MRADAEHGADDLRRAYHPPATGGQEQTVGIFDAFDNPNVENDLAAYRAKYGLPPCDTANGCFHKINQKGQASPLPQGDAGWGVEMSLDVDMVSAARPGCRIVLVEADDASLANLAAAVDTAIAQGAAVVSNSYGTSESGAMNAFVGDHTHPGCPVRRRLARCRADGA